MTYPNEWKPKGLIEHLCNQQTFAPDPYTRRILQLAIDLLHQHRPVGPDGKHNDRHTDTCGCDRE